MDSRGFSLTGLNYSYLKVLKKIDNLSIWFVNKREQINHLIYSEDKTETPLNIHIQLSTIGKNKQNVGWVLLGLKLTLWFWRRRLRHSQRYNMWKKLSRMNRWGFTVKSQRKTVNFNVPCTHISPHPRFRKCLSYSWRWRKRCLVCKWWTTKFFNSYIVIHVAIRATKHWRRPFNQSSLFQ